MPTIVLEGRDEELSRLLALLDPGGPEERAPLVLGDLGTGKSALLAGLAGPAAGAGMRVLTVQGRAAEADRHLAALHRLLGDGPTRREKPVEEWAIETLARRASSSGSSPWASSCARCRPAPRSRPRPARGSTRWSAT
ncbi:AAA family ATPase [Dactylosporangium sp. NPDC051484]|uniref:AAA family ATPase n=1 Tax=Dactylosporangium sp. NPDC051484 TaxID=3154942 RepID=UPI00344B0638